VKRVGNLWSELISWENLVLASDKARKGKTNRPVVQRFDYNLENELIQLQDELTSFEYLPGEFKTFWITRPKPRLISAAPYRDRVIHHALMNVLEPVLDRRFHPDSYACRKEKGTHAASDRCQQWLRKKKYFAHLDVEKFFPSIDHQIMKNIFRKFIKDSNVLNLMDMIVDCSAEQEKVTNWFPGDNLLTPAERKSGLPIGNLSSQWFGNWYLNEVDHFMTAHLGIGAYVRYCDDIVIFDNDREKLKDAMFMLEDKMGEMRLKIHKKDLHVHPSYKGLTFVGFRTKRTYKKLAKKNVQLFRRRLRWMLEAYQNGMLDDKDVKCRIEGWIGHAKQADSFRLIKSFDLDWTFCRDTDERSTRAAWWLLEQQN